MTPFRRIAVTVPPEAWFHGIAAAMFRLYRQALRDLGCEIFDVPVEALLAYETARTNAVISALRDFRPDCAFGLHKGSYALICRVPRRFGYRPNLFTDVLNLPTIILWDHAPLDLADQLLSPHPGSPAASRRGALASLRRTLTDPRLIHWSPDTGQTALMLRLGLLVRPPIEEPLPTLPGFTRSTSAQESGVGFVGHFYQDPEPLPHPTLETLAANTIDAWTAAPTQSLWDLLDQNIQALPAHLRSSNALNPDETYYWHYVHRLIVHRAQTAIRLRLLAASPVPVTCYGNLTTSAPGVAPHLIPAPGHIPFGPALAAALARHEITIDVLNPGSIHGISHKPMLAFASGGFMLVNRKRDFISTFGDAAEAVSFNDAAELAAKLDYFLANPRSRREAGDALRQQIAARYQLHHVLARVLQAAADQSRAARTQASP
jgi:hypothetical protein